MKKVKLKQITENLNAPIPTSLLVGIERPWGCVAAQPSAVVPDAPLGHVDGNGGEEKEEKDAPSPAGQSHFLVATPNRLLKRRITLK